MNDRVFSAEEVQDLTDRVFLLREKLEAGKIQFAEHLIDGFQSSWAAIKIRSDGLVDPYSVDGRIRAMTLAVKAFKYREELKAAYSIGDIQEIYFKILDQQFGRFYEAMTKAGASPSQAGEVLARDDSFVRHAIDALPELIEEIRLFWAEVAEIGAIHLQDGQQLKASFSGDIFPAHWENVVSMAGLYVDTIVLPCPITRLGTIVRTHPTASTVATFLKHVFTAMTYRSLATADVSPPVVLILPAEDEVDGGSRASLIERATPMTLKHASYLFGRQFSEVQELIEFCSSMASVDRVLNELRRGDRLLIDSDWPRTPRDQLERALSSDYPVPPGFDPRHPGHQVLNSCIGRMPQALDAREKAVGFGGTPLISAPTSWEYFTWMLEYASRNESSSEDASKHLHVVHALSAGAERLQWLGNVPMATVLEIRKAGLAEEVRAILSSGIGSLTKINPENYGRTANQVANNLDRAFESHQSALRDAMAQKMKFYGIDVASCIAVGGIAVAAAITASPLLGAASGVLGIVGAPNVKDIRSRYSGLREAERARQRSPTGLLFQHLS